MEENKKSLINIPDICKPIEKLFECLSSGFGNLFNPYLVKKNADSNAYEIKTLLESINNKDNIINTEININRNGTNINIKNDPALNYMLSKETKKFENTSKIIQNTAEILKNIDNVSEEPLDKDWLTRFFGIAEDITNEEMQNLWSKILADEIIKPNSYSLRTLETLRNLSSKEALLFTQFANLCFEIASDNVLGIINGYEFLKEFDITIHDLQLLIELNLIHECVFCYVKPDSKLCLLYNDKFIGIENKNEFSISIPINKLTVPGKEISNLINRTFKLSFAEKLSKSLSENISNLSISIVDINLDTLEYCTKDVKIL